MNTIGFLLADHTIRQLRLDGHQPLPREYASAQSQEMLGARYAGAKTRHRMVSP
jgi:hypothetical protein